MSIEPASGKASFCHLHCYPSVSRRWLAWLMLPELDNGAIYGPQTHCPNAYVKLSFLEKPTPSVKKLGRGFILKR